MKKYINILVFFFMLTLLGSCISFKIKPLLPADNQVECIYLCKKIDESGDLLEPLNIQSEFTSQDKYINCFVRLKDVTTKISLRWKWYSPDKKMIRDTGDVIVNQREKYLEVVTAYDNLKLSAEEEVEGEWTVILFIDNRFVGKNSFRLTASR